MVSGFSSFILSRIFLVSSVEQSSPMTTSMSNFTSWLKTLSIACPIYSAWLYVITHTETKGISLEEARQMVGEAPDRYEGEGEERRRHDIAT